MTDGTMRIVITGTPGTGKTEVAQIFSRITAMQYVSLNDIVEKRKIAKVNKKGEKEVDIKKLQKIIGDYFIVSNNYVVEGHLSCEVVIPCDEIFVLRTHPDVLRKRLKERGYPKEKIDENIEAEMLDYCAQKVREVYEWRPIELDTSRKNPFEIANRMKRMLKYKVKVGDSIDYSKELKKKLKLK